MKNLRETAERLEAEAKSLRLGSVVELRLQGMTFEEIGRELGISRQRAHQLWTEANDKGAA